MKRKRIGIFIVFVIAVPLVIIFINKKEHSDEYQMMQQTTTDIKGTELLRAETDIDQIISSIAIQDHTFKDESDTVIARIILDLRKLKEEAEFRNMDEESYKESFIKILDELAYLETEDGLALIEHHEHKKAIEALLKARQHLKEAEEMNQ